jgi:hypothetical protein
MTRSRRRVLAERLALAGLALYALVLVLVLGPVRDALGTRAQEGPVPPGVMVAPDPAAAGRAVEAPAPALPQLAGVDRLRAAAALDADKRLRAALGTSDYRIEQVGPWTTSNGPWTARKQPALLGVAMLVTLPAPVAIEAKELPGVLYDVTERTSPPYQEVRSRIDARDVTQLLVLFDLRRGRIVNISPGPGATVVAATAPAGFQRTVPAVSNEHPDAPAGPAAGGS